MQHPLISIIMPAHNAASYLAEAVDSVLSQRYEHLELLVVDDASTDETPEILARFRDKRLRVLRVAGLHSPAKSRNVGIQAAQGDYIGFLDADHLCPVTNPVKTAA